MPKPVRATIDVRGCDSLDRLFERLTAARDILATEARMIWRDG